MSKIHLRRGLTRLYLVLWVVWIPILLWLTHTSYVEEQRMWTRRAIEAESRGFHDEAATARTVAKGLDDQWRADRLILLPLYGLVLPALLYGFLYGSIMTLRWVLLWVIGGFKHNPPEQPTGSP